MRIKKTLTPKRIAANQRNARKSTGPKTRRGKSFSRLNGVRHGAFAEHLVLLPGDNPADFAALRMAYRKFHKPANQLEDFLVDRMILCAWRLTRMAALESTLVHAHNRTADDGDSIVRDMARAYRKVIFGPNHPWNKKLDAPATDEEAEAEEEDDRNNPALDPTARAFLRDSERGNALPKLSRYQVTLERSFFRSLHELQRLRERLPDRSNKNG